MNDWSAYRSDLTKTLGQVGRINPDVLKGYTQISNAAPAEPTLDAKTRELIALAVAVTTRCDGCIAVHSDAARKAGATKEELTEALGVAIALNAGAALVYTARAFDAFTENAG
ncbi:carboxymuconolactone decarboxylase family protein [Methylobacterium sp. C25]|uniref:carboxymuconolactone decarboxylase family protein n=1 Tax=Methylobacterium sp. C25 TaxID=2721622 RepID=UPI001F3FA5A6|nr:carboxymuconolactone decarboxylase family protein [Methylobacterium sp. C25]MCE4225728.1 carboxymuconolactone decarboxylase family protein [Methylobacterium sp. C25]